MSKESRYFCKRKCQAKILSILFLIMRIFPVKKDKIVFSTFEGDGGFCCNPRYIAEELHRRDFSCEMIWLTHDVRRNFPDYVKVIKYTPWNIAYHLTTAKIWVDNYRKPYGTIKRKGQIYLQTWHASIGFKAVGLYRGESFPKIAKKVSEWDSKLIDVMISNSKYCDQIYPKKLLYSGPTLRVGSPRVDCLINEKSRLHERIHQKLQVEKNTKLVLFAPTFRGGNQKAKKKVTSPIPTIDFDRLIRNLETKTECKWNVLLRLHPQLSAHMNKMSINCVNEKIIDVSQEEDMSEVMGGCDLVITDYSSCAFDACFAGIPVLLYADDVKEYIANRGNFMWKREQLPFLMAENNDELMENVKKFNRNVYNEKIRLFAEKYEICENGHACQDIVDLIEEYMK
ncbi:MAG: CDP-glycerol glycerophosphotransferase family protein [Lachnospiraceae bacterium]|nr:CDP-glycerol glycerophosphotransferase family protein [Lachnospiraceae bacterium]